jgi:sulfonate transport system permease protein
MSGAAGHAIHAPRATSGGIVPRRAPRFVQPAWRNLLVGLLVPCALLTVWAAAGALDRLPALILPAPGAVLIALRDIIQSGDLGSALAISFLRLAEGFGLGALAGLAVGATMGLSRLGERIIRPTLMGFVQIPVLAWVPLLMIPFGIGETLKCISIGIAAFAPVAMNSFKGLRQVDPKLMEVGTLYRFSAAQRLRHILLPGALPSIFTGLRLGLTQAWQSLVVVELVASTNGIGYLAVMARQMFQLDQMLAVMLVIGVCGFALDKSLRSAEARLGRRFGRAAS